MANINYTIEQTNDGIQGGLDYKGKAGDIDNLKSTITEVLNKNYMNLNLKYKEIKNFDNATDPGIWNITKLDESTNPPPGSNDARFIFIVYKYNNYIYQICIRWLNGNIYYRLKYTDEKWTEWQYVLNTNSTIKVSQGGTGVTTLAALKENLKLDKVENKSSATIRSELTKTNVTNALGYTPAETDLTKMKGILPMIHGGTGRSWSNNNTTDGKYIPPKNAIIKMDDDDKLKRMDCIATKAGAFYAIGDNAAPQFGRLPIAYGGTGTTFSSAKSGDIVYYYKKDEKTAPQLWAKSILDLSHGGTGTGFSKASHGDIVYYYKKDKDSTPQLWAEPTRKFYTTDVFIKDAKDESSKEQKFKDLNITLGSYIKHKCKDGGNDVYWNSNLVFCATISGLVYFRAQFYITPNIDIEANTWIDLFTWTENQEKKFIFDPGYTTYCAMYRPNWAGMIQAATKGTNGNQGQEGKVKVKCASKLSKNTTYLIGLSAVYPTQYTPIQLLDKIK